MDFIELDRQELNIICALLDLALELSTENDIRASLSRIRNFLKKVDNFDENVDNSGEISEIDHKMDFKKEYENGPENRKSSRMLSKNDASIVRYSINVYEMLRRGRYESLKEKYGIDIMDDVDKSWMKKAEAIIPDELYDAGYLKRLSKSLKNSFKEVKTPSRKLYISDLHFFHDNLCKRMDNRPFLDHQEMNEHMIKVWNENVTKKDEVYILGDFSIAKGKATNEILSQLAGKKYLVIGNHDYFLEDKEFDTSLFQWIKPYAEIGDNGRRVVLSHYPIFCYNGQYRKKPDGQTITYMLYGHVHDTHDEQLVNQFIEITKQTKVMSEGLTEPAPIPCNMINCFCMFSDYIPLTLDEWIVVDAQRREKIRQEMQ